VGLNRQFAASTLSVVREIEGKFFGGREICSTYENHGVPDVRGVNGKPWGIDVWIAPYGQRANKAQEALGDSVQKFLETNWDRLGIHYVIYWGWMTYMPGQWFKYDPGTYNNPIASPDPDTVMHMDHLHIQRKVNGPYSPPKGDAPADKPGDLITLQQLAEISQNQNPEAYDLAGDIKALVPAMKAAQIVTKPRIAAFIANVSHETDHLNTLEEYGDEAYFRSFLGNEWRYHGRGYLMNTWRAAYQRLSDIFGVDLVNNPDLLAKDKDLAARAATWFWTNNGLNRYADAGNFWAVSATINTGNPNAKSMNGWPERKAAYERAMRILPETGPVAPKKPRLKPNLVAVGQLDEEAMHAAALVFRWRGFDVTSTRGEDGVAAFDGIFGTEPLGTRQMVVIGGPALRALAPASQAWVQQPANLEVSDYIGAVGEGYEDTLSLVEGICEQYAGKGAGAEFRAVLGARAAPPRPVKPPVSPVAPVQPKPAPPKPEEEEPVQPTNPEPPTPEVTEPVSPEGPPAPEPTEPESPGKGPKFEPVLWGTAAKFLVLLFVAYSGVALDEAAQQDLATMLAEMLPELATALVAYIGIWLAERQSVKPMAKIDRRG
jgi:putative chitinase